MTYEEFNKLKPGAKLTEDQVKDIRLNSKSSRKERYGRATGCFCKECGLEYYVSESDIRQLVAKVDRVTGQVVKEITDINCGCRTEKIWEFLNNHERKSTESQQ